jgi:hypothetical protein
MDRCFFLVDLIMCLDNIGRFSSAGDTSLAPIAPSPSSEEAQLATVPPSDQQSMDVVSVDSQSVVGLPKFNVSTTIKSGPVPRPVVASATAASIIAPAPAARTLPANRMDHLSRPPAASNTPATAPSSSSDPVPVSSTSTTASPSASVSAMTTTTAAVTAKFAEIVALSQQLAASHTAAIGPVAVHHPSEVRQSRDTQLQQTTMQQAAPADKTAPFDKAGAAKTLTTGAPTATVRPTSAPNKVAASKTVTSAQRSDGGVAVTAKTSPSSSMATKVPPMLPRVGWVAPQGSTPAAKAISPDDLLPGSDGGPHTNTTLSSLNESSYCEEDSSYMDSSYSSDQPEDSVVANNLRQLQEFKSLLGALPDRLAAALAASAPPASRTPVAAIHASSKAQTSVADKSTKAWVMSVPNDPPLRRAPVTVRVVVVCVSSCH